MANEQEWMQLFDKGILIADGFGRIYRAKMYGKDLEIPNLIGTSGNRYKNVACKMASGKQRTIRAHRLIWWLFKGPIPDGLEINHKNGDKFDNIIGNLELLTHKENVQHSFDELGRQGVRGKLHHNAKLDRFQVLDIRRLHEMGEKKDKLAREFKVSIQNIHAIVNRVSWKHL